MSLIRTFTLMAALGAASLTFADTPKAPAQADKKADKGKKEQLSQATADKFIAFFDKLVEIAVANKDDCTKMATAVNAHIDPNQALIKEVVDAKLQNKEAPQAMKDHITQKSRDELQPAIAKCSQDKAVLTAFGRLRGSRPAK